MAKKNESDSDVFYVGLKADKEVKRNILESMKEILQSLQKFEDYRKIRLEKNRVILDLKRNIKEINELTGKLKVSLPKSNLNAKLTKEEIIIEEEIIEMGTKKEQKIEKDMKLKKRSSEIIKEKESKKIEEIPKVPKTDIEKLEMELSDIESKLKGL